MILVLALLATAQAVLAQTAALRGQVTDESGAVIPAAQVTLHGPSGLVRTVTAAADGAYSFAGLPPGNYTVQASAPELAMARPAAITLRSGAQSLNLQLQVASTVQQVTVQGNGAPTVSADAAANASALVLRGEDLQALGDSPEDLQADLLALAGPSAGPNGGAIFIDGFSGGQLPSKDSIREIRINQNPFAPEYDKLGYGRIEIFTKPGTDKFRGTGFFNLGDSVWNTRNAYAARKAPFLLKEYGGNLSGPLGRRASFFLDLQRHSIDNGAIINGTTLDPETLAIVNPFTDVLRIPQRRVMLGPRVDYQLSASHTLTVRYGFLRSDIQDAGVGSFNLVSRGFHVENTEHHVQISETAVLGSRAVNEIRFQFFHPDTSLLANNLSPAIQVLGSFSGGGAQVGHALHTQSSYEFQNYTSLLRGKHSWKFGIRLRGDSIHDTSPQNFGGTFTFGGGTAPLLDAGNQLVLDASGQPALAQITSIERYRRTLLFQKLGLPAAQIRALGGGATQFSINAGIPAISAGQADVGLFAGDDWRARPNLTLSFGVRYETQSNIHDWRDFAPRIGVAWAPGARAGKARPKTVLRAGFGMFYDRFALASTLAAQRYNGIVQQQYVVANPDFFPLIPAISALGGFQSTQTIQQVSRGLRAPYMMQTALGYERQLPFNATLAVTYANSHGLHLFRSDVIQAANPIFLMESAGLYNQNQLIVNVNARVSQDISLFASYMVNRAMSNTDGLGTFPASPRSFAGEYGPAATDVRERVTLGGSFNLKWNVRLSPLVFADSGPPFDITVGRDLYGDTLFNGRPGIATDPNQPGVIATRYGLLDPNPAPGEKLLPRNFGRGPGSLMTSLRISKTIAFGPSREGAGEAWRGPGSGSGGLDRRGTGGAFGMGGAAVNGSSAANRRFNLILSLSIRNLFNHNNPGPIIGNITSPLFGQANQPAGANQLGGTGFSESANNRRLEAQMRFTF